MHCRFWYVKASKLYNRIYITDLYLSIKTMCWSDPDLGWRSRLLRWKVRALAGDQLPAICAFHPDIEIAQMKGFGLAFGGQIDMDYSGDQRRILVDTNVSGFAIRRGD